MIPVIFNIYKTDKNLKICLKKKKEKKKVLKKPPLKI